VSIPPPSPRSRPPSGGGYLGLDESFSLPGGAPSARGERERALDLAYKALGRRERTVAEVRSLLERKRVEPGAIELAVTELTESGLLDDVRFAKRFADDKRTLERWGAGRIERELQRRGIGPELVVAAIAEQDRGDELQAALALLAERSPQPPANDRERDRVWRLLVRRGYEPELAYEAVRAHARRLAGPPQPA
jgi:regulatory protein